MSAPVTASPPWALRADKRTPFFRLVAVETRKLLGTRSDRIALALAPLLIVGATWLMTKGLNQFGSAFQQLLPGLLAIQIGQILVHAAAIKLVAGEWHYRSVQPTLLAQPSRGRYLAAQCCVLAGLLTVCVAVQLAAFGWFIGARLADKHTQNLLALRPAWWMATMTLGCLILMLMAWAIALHVPNTATALTIYAISVVALMFARLGVPAVFSWFDAFSATFTMAGRSANTDNDYGGAAAMSLAVAILAITVGTGVWRIYRRDAA